jgi:SAM-dependent methyltransferase
MGRLRKIDGSGIRDRAGEASKGIGPASVANLMNDSPRQVIPIKRSEFVSNGVTADSGADSGAPDYGTDYLEWKHWNPENFGHLCRRENADFAAFLRKARVQIPVGAPVLEVGFGNGTFLEFGRRRGWQMQGTEVNPGLLKRATECGFQVTGAETLEPFPSQAFQMVAAFDVMEHIPLELLPGFLSEVRRVLKSGGYFVARFPNGDSPFGRHIQNGDVTHKTAIGSIRARYLAMQAGMPVVFLDSEVQAIWSDRTHTPHRLFAVPVKKLMNAFLNLVFSPRDPLPLCSANLQLVLRKPNP